MKPELNGSFEFSPEYMSKKSIEDYAADEIERLEKGITEARINRQALTPAQRHYENLKILSGKKAS